MKLKTINDLDCSMKQIGDEGALEFENTFQSIKETFKWIKENDLEDSRDVFYVEYKELRQSAKEHIKELEKVKIEDDHEEFIANGWTIRWIRHFFNLDDKKRL